MQYENCFNQFENAIEKLENEQLNLDQARKELIYDLQQILKTEKTEIDKQFINIQNKQKIIEGDLKRAVSHGDKICKRIEQWKQNIMRLKDAVNSLGDVNQTHQIMYNDLKQLYDASFKK